MRMITDGLIREFRLHLIEDEKADSTVEKYIRDVTAFASWLNYRELDKFTTLEYKKVLTERYAPSSVNSIISSINSFFTYQGWINLTMKTIKVQKQIFVSSEKELTKPEYEKLLSAAQKKRSKLYYLMQAICSTGIRVSEHKFITVEAIKRGQTTINCKGKMRVIILPKQLCDLLLGYIQKYNIKSGPVFVSRSGRAMDRSNIWAAMKRLCALAGVPKEKVFPHNLRHLFARTFYTMQRDVVRLADILGHANINTTRIYTIETGEVHRNQIQKLGLLQV